VRTVIDHNIYPGLDFLLYRMEDGRYPAEPDNLSMTLRLYHNTFTLLVRLGLFAASAREFRQSYPDSPLDHQLNAAEELREELRRLWGSSEMCYLVENRESLPELAQYILQQVCPLHRSVNLSTNAALTSNCRSRSSSTPLSSSPTPASGPDSGWNRGKRPKTKSTTMRR
jgi:hypothetical protein